MIRTALICLTIALLASTAAIGAADVDALEARVEVAEERIQNQLEKIKLIRELADAQMDLTLSRMSQQLSNAQENMAVQVEALQRFREQLGGTTGGSAETARSNSPNLKSAVTANAKGSIDQFCAEVDRQILATNALIQEMERIRLKLDTGDRQRDQSSIAPVPFTAVR
jgi:hypothetical protein